MKRGGREERDREFLDANSRRDVLVQMKLIGPGRQNLDWKKSLAAA